MSTEVPIVTSIKRWWHQPDSFGWISSYLRARGMMRISRALVASIVLALAVIGTVLMFSPSAVHGTWMRGLTWAAIVVALGCGVLFIVRWPTRRQSIAFIMTINVCIALVCNTQSQPMIGLIGCAAFAITGGYIACFHSSGWMLCNFAFAILLSIIQAGRSGFGEDSALLLTALLLVLLMNTGVPFGVQAVVHVLGIDLLQARYDPLTGLLNRRAFFDRVDELLQTGGAAPRYLVVVMADLDRFKALNDAHGHAFGDKALVAVGRVLTAVAPGGIITGRVGGEEFLLADLSTTPAPPTVAQRVCDAVATLPFPITASVGTAVGRVDHLTPADHQDLVQTLHTLADTAMYDAKRAGGNRVSHASALS